MKSSYLNNDVNYGDLISAAIFNKNPQNIVEFGILDGFSLKIFVDNFPDANINAFDIFDEFNGNCAKKDIIEKFAEYKNVNIEYGNFYDKYNDLDNIDILHIDIANNGDVIEFLLENYLPKLSSNGLIIFEGGSEERDNIDWMQKYNKRKIKPILDDLKRMDIEVKTFGRIPSITLIKKNKDFNIHRLCENDFYKGFFELINYFTRNLQPESFDKAINNLELFNNDCSVVLVAEYKDKIIATGKILLENKIHNNLRKVGHIEDMVVSEDYRSNGVGKLLLKELIKIGKENDCYKIVLECHSDISQFYEKNGFIKKGTEMSLYF